MLVCRRALCGSRQGGNGRVGYGWDMDIIWIGYGWDMDGNPHFALGYGWVMDGNPHFALGYGWVMDGHPHFALGYGWVMDGHPHFALGYGWVMDGHPHFALSPEFGHLWSIPHQHEHARDVERAGKRAQLRTAPEWYGGRYP
jgi:hypothetical protein